VLVFDVIALGLTEAQTGLLLTATLVGDTIVSLLLTTRADRIGRRATLIAGAVLMAAAGVAFASTRSWWWLVLAGTIGVISPSGHEVGPFLSIEQAALAQIVPDRGRTTLFAWYTLAGSMATALGSLAGGTLVYVLQRASVPSVDAYRSVVLVYAAIGVILTLLFTQLSTDSEATSAAAPQHAGILAALSGVPRSGQTVWKLSALFAHDSFGGGFASARWTSRPGSPTSWPSSRPRSDRPRPGSRVSRGRWAPPSVRCWPAPCSRSPSGSAFRSSSPEA
jgi:MFS family permease